MYIMATFPSMATGRLVNSIKVSPMDGDLVQRTESVLSESTVEMIIQYNTMERHPMESGVLQGSPVLPIIFVLYTSGLIKWVEEAIPEAEGLSQLHNFGWVATGSNDNIVVMILERFIARALGVQAAQGYSSMLQWQRRCY
jgi:hypothetical protein